MDTLKYFVKRLRVFLTNDADYIYSLNEYTHLKDQLINQLCEITNLSFDDIYQYIEEISLMIETTDKTIIQIQITQLTSLISDSFVRNEMIETIQSKNNNNKTRIYKMIGIKSPRFFNTSFNKKI